VEAVIDACAVREPIALEVSYDEFDVDVVLTYTGAALEFPDQPPTHEEILDTDHGPRRLAGFLIRRHADRMTATHNDGRTMVRLHFAH
jgi:xanthine permease XanP